MYKYHIDIRRIHVITHRALQVTLTLVIGIPTPRSQDHRIEEILEVISRLTVTVSYVGVDV